MLCRDLSKGYIIYSQAPTVDCFIFIDELSPTYGIKYWLPHKDVETLD